MTYEYTKQEFLHKGYLFSVEYSLAPVGKTCEDLGFKTIHNETTCKAAMDELKLTYLKIHRELGIENTMFWPKGCYFIPSSGTVYMNKNHTASKVDDATSELTRSICTDGMIYTFLLINKLFYTF